MKRPKPTRAVLLIALVLAGAYECAAASPPPLTTLRQIHNLTPAEAARKPPVAFVATVTYRREGENTLFVQDGDNAIFVWAKPEFKVSAGDRVLIVGNAQPSFRPMVIPASIAVLRHIGLPPPVPAVFDDLIRSRFDCVRVTVRGRIQSADMVMSGGGSALHMHLLTDGGVITVYVNSTDPGLSEGLLDSEVQIAGVAAATLDGKLQKTGVALNVISFGDVKLLNRTAQDPWTLPIIPMDSILDTYHVNNLSSRVRIHGTITYYQPGSALVLQSGARSLWVKTSYEQPLPIGAEADVTGLPKLDNDFLALDGGEIRQLHVYAPVTPESVTARDLSASLNAFDLVSVAGKVVTEVREGGQDQYVLESDGQTFSAIYRHPKVADRQPPPFNVVPLGSKVVVNGICMLENSYHYDGDVPFNLLMRTPADIAVVARPSILNVRNLIVAVGLLLVVVFTVGAKGWMIERKLRRQTAAWASIERSRSRILEDINGSTPLSKIMEHIKSMVSSRLDGAPCWFEIADGPQWGTRPGNSPSLRLTREPIPARQGPPIGIVSAAFDPFSIPRPIESEVLTMAAELATLAIETRRLYSDLRHRSEFDLLTDIHNRFSLEKCLEEEIERATRTAAIFGLIYIDLDRFKEINDRYGHHIGDRYLQTVTTRMNCQLRSVDILARLGGDEFVALIPMAHTRAHVEEIARRLENCFIEPFALESRIVYTSASFGIALYPTDGTTKDSLLKAADTAMYIVKNAKRQSEPAPADSCPVPG